MHQTIPHTRRMWISSGNGSAGGMVCQLKNPDTLRGAEAATRDRP